MTVALCLTGIAPASAQSLTTSQQTAVSNAINASSAIGKQLTLGTAFSAGFAASVNNGVIVDPNAYQAATISEQQRQAYNGAIGTFSTTDFYTAKQFLQQQAAIATANMQASISALASASVDLQKTVTVNQMLSTITDAPTAKSTQTAIAVAGLNSEVTTSQVSAYNTSLASVNSYASQAATFFKAANNTTITGNIDSFKASYNKDLSQAYAATGYNSANPYVVVSWGDGFGIGQAGLSQYTQSSQAFYAANDPFAPR
jgi:hypothetical protein